MGRQFRRRSKNTRRTANIANARRGQGNKAGQITIQLKELTAEMNAINAKIGTGSFKMKDIPIARKKLLAFSLMMDKIEQTQAITSDTRNQIENFRKVIADAMTMLRLYERMRKERGF